MEHISKPLKRVAGDVFMRVCKQKLGIDMVAEHRFCERRWRFDYANPGHRIAVEVEGGVWTRGRHTRGSGFVKDMEKYNRAAVEGWCVIRVTPGQLLAVETLDMIRRAMELRGAA